jgi:hypothetical protein
MVSFWLKASFISSLTAIIWAIPISAHETEISEDVGATFHIEPNDTAKAGEPAQVWFALTRAGGTSIPLDKCDCQLAIYAQPRSPNTKPILQPLLKPLSTEGYKNIPSSTVTFPKIGIYDLEIIGKPVGGEDFKPFKLNFKITVASAIAQTPNPAVKEPKSAPNQTAYPLIPIMAGLGIIGLGGGILLLNQSKPKP